MAKESKARKAIADVKGRALIERFVQRCLQRKITESEALTEMGLNHVYFADLRRGDRHIHKMEDATLRRFATFIGVPLVEVFMLAGKLERGDMMYEETLEDRISLVYQQMGLDMRFAQMMPSYSTWQAMEKEAKLFMIFMYQQLNAQILLELAQYAFTLSDDGMVTLVRTAKKGEKEDVPG